MDTYTGFFSKVDDDAEIVSLERVSTGKGTGYFEVLFSNGWKGTYKYRRYDGICSIRYSPNYGKVRGTCEMPVSISPDKGLQGVETLC